MGKKFEAAKARVAPNGDIKEYGLQEGVDILKEIHFAKFDETVELAVALGVDPKHADQMVRGSVVLPHGTGKKVRILVFAKGEKDKEARDAGAEYVGAEDMIEKVSKGWMDFDRVVATPDMMGAVGRLGKILGPRGLMPNPKTGTVSFDVAKTIREIRRGKVEYRVEKAGIVHVPVGKMSFETDQIRGNVATVLESILKAKPPSAKGKYVKSITLSATMSPGIALDVAAVTKALGA